MEVHQRHLIAFAKELEQKLGPANETEVAKYNELFSASIALLVVHAAREEARWVLACQITSELAAEAGVTDDDRAWAASVLGLDTDG